MFADGANALTDAIAADLGCPAELDRAVVAVSQDAGAVTLGTADGESLRAALCVLAVPINVYRRSRSIRRSAATSIAPSHAATPAG